MNEVTKVNMSLPAHLQGKEKTTKIGNIDSKDLIIPRVKLLQSTSEEITTFDNAKIGQFWHTIGEIPLGERLLGIPIILRKSIALWAPRGDDRGKLAQSSDMIHWDNDAAGLKFKVKHKGMKEEVEYDLKGSVAESGLDQFGSKIPGDKDSPPAASLTYHIMWLFPEFPHLGPAIIINTRSSVKPAKALLSKIDMAPVDHYALQFEIGTKQEKGDEGPYLNYTYTGAGYAEEAHYEQAKTLYEFWDKQDWKVNDEKDETPSGEGGGGGAPAGKANPEMAKKKGF